jgi:hypothetical protein
MRAKATAGGRYSLEREGTDSRNPIKKRVLPIKRKEGLMILVDS